MDSERDRTNLRIILKLTKMPMQKILTLFVLLEVIELIHELVDVHGGDGVAFYTRLEIRRKIREKLSELNCEEEIIGASN